MDSVELSTQPKQKKEQNMRETATDLKISDDYQTDWEYHKQDALREMYGRAECIAQHIEHYIDFEELTIELDKLDVVHKAITDIKELAEYTYKGCQVNRWNEEYEEDFDYFFGEEVKGFLVDNLGYVWGEL